MKHRYLLLGVSLFTVVVSFSARAEEASVGTCRDFVHTSLAREQRLYRSVVFGLPEPRDAIVGEVRFDSSGSPWIKSAENVWTNVNRETLSDAEMSSHGEIPARPSIFATKRVLTSELVPLLTQAYRALDCRIGIVCRTVEQSIAVGDDAASSEMEIREPGCVIAKALPADACRIVAGEEQKAAEADIRTYCRSVGEELLLREGDLLKLSVEYDAAYRSLLQLAGNLDLFLQEFRWPLSGTLRKAAAVLGSLHRIPCFTAACDAFPLNP